MRIGFQVFAAMGVGVCFASNIYVPLPFQSSAPTTSHSTAWSLWTTLTVSSSIKSALETDKA